MLMWMILMIIILMLAFSIHKVKSTQHVYRYRSIPMVSTVYRLACCAPVVS